MSAVRDRRRVPADLPSADNLLEAVEQMMGSEFAEMMSQAIHRAWWVGYDWAWRESH